MIAGDSWRESEIKRLLKSVEPHVEGIFVSYNGSKGKLPWSKWTKVPLSYEVLPWDDNFAAARNSSRAMIPNNKFDWWMWLDTDDVFHAPNGLDPVFDLCDSWTKGVLARYDYAIEPETGEVVVTQRRERIMATDWDWQWRYRIHEVCAAPVGTQIVDLRNANDLIWVEHLRKAGEARGARERNRRILVKALQENPEPRFRLYFANETLAEANDAEDGPEKKSFCEAAIVAYRQYLTESGGLSDEQYNAAVRIGDAFAMKRDYDGAIDAYLQAAKYYPNWRDAWVGAAKAAMELGDWWRMEQFADLALKVTPGDTNSAREPLEQQHNPLLLRGLAREEQRKWDEAIEDMEAAREVWIAPGDPLKDKIESIKQKKLLDPHDQIEKDRQRLRSTKPDKSICFYTNPIPETWNYSTLEEGGHGGAETLVLQMAERFAADGWRTVIFGCPGDDRGVYPLPSGSEVELWDSGDWNPIEEFTVFVSSRAPHPWGARMRSKNKFLWLHDVNSGPGMLDGNPPMIERPDKLIALSEWHRRHLIRLYECDPDRVVVIPNGVDLSMFPHKENTTDGHRFVYASSPDRGLEQLLALWPEIKSRWPDATLDIFYGWEFIDKLIARGYTMHAYLKAQVKQGIEQLGGEDAGIFERGRVSPAKLAEAWCNADVWAHPTMFMETFCLTAVQAQLGGAIPVTSNLGALTETVANPWLLVDGWSKNVSYHRAFIDRLEDLFDESNVEPRAVARLEGRQHAEKYSLDNAYAAWHDLFKASGVSVA